MGFWNRRAESVLVLDDDGLSLPVGDGILPPTPVAIGQGTQSSYSQFLRDPIIWRGETGYGKFLWEQWKFIYCQRAYRIFLEDVDESTSGNGQALFDALSSFELNTRRQGQQYLLVDVVGRGNAIVDPGGSHTIYLVLFRRRTDGSDPASLTKYAVGTSPNQTFFWVPDGWALAGVQTVTSQGRAVFGVPPSPHYGKDTPSELMPGTYKLLFMGDTLLDYYPYTAYDLLIAHPY